MEVWMNVLQILLYLLGAGLLTVVIIAVVKLFGTINRVNTLLDDLQSKSETLDGLFDTIENVSNTANTINDRIVKRISKFVGKVQTKRRKKITKEEDEYE